MIRELKFKKIIALLILGFILVWSIFFLKEQFANKEVPKKAIFVDRNLERSEMNG